MPESTFSGCKTLGEVECKLRTALDAKGYAQRSYFSAPNGFALVTQLEQYNAAYGSCVLIAPFGSTIPQRITLRGCWTI